MSSDKIIISCAGDKELARQVYSYLQANLSSSKGHNMHDPITLAEDEIEIMNDRNAVSQDDLYNILIDFLESDKEKYSEYEISDLENIFTVGIKKDLLKDMKTCEYCGYMSKDYDDMYMHRLVCAAITRL